MVNDIKKTVRLAGIIITILFSCFFPLIPLASAQTPLKPEKIQYNWSLETFSAQVDTVWDYETFLMNETGTYNEVFNYSRGYALNDNEWIEEESIFTYDVNYSYYSNLNLLGNYSLDINFDVYKVDISYGSSVYFIWIGLKNGTFNAEYNINYMTHDFKHENVFYKKSETTYRKYNSTTMALLDVWNEYQAR